MLIQYVRFQRAQAGRLRSSDGSSKSKFEITARFEALNQLHLPAVRGGIGNPEPVHGAAVLGTIDRQGRLQHRTALIDASGEQILLKSGVPLKGQAKEQFKDHDLSFSQRYARWSDIHEHRPEVWLLRPDNLFVSLYQWKTGPLKRLASLLARRFFASTWAIEFQGKQREMPKGIRVAHEFLTAAVQQFPFWRDDLKPRLEAALSGYVGRQGRFELAPRIEAVEDWLADQLLMGFSADSGAAATPLEKMGSGWQSLVRMAALEVLTDYPDEVARRVVLLFEEPESYLHPHLARKLRQVLDRLSSVGWTVVATTHSPNLVSFSSSQVVVRLQRQADELIARRLEVEHIDGAAKFQERIDERGAHEMLFASRVVLCEGQDDAFAIRSYLEKRRSVDLDGRGVSVVRTGDVNQLAAFAEMAKRLGISWCAISDQDTLDSGGTNPATEKARGRLEQHLTSLDKSVMWKVDLEHCLGKAKGKADPSWQAMVIEPKTNDELADQCPDFVRTCDEIAEWVEGGTPGGSVV